MLGNTAGLRHRGAGPVTGRSTSRTGKWIVYTSADSVFQIAAHEDTVPLTELYAACEAARGLLQGEHGVSRVIARPFEGEPGAWVRTPRRKDFSLPPPGPTLLDRLAERHIPRVGVGKVDDLFAGRGISSIHTATNAEAYALIEGALLAMERGLLLANVIEFDQTWGHRNDVPGFVRGLQELDLAASPAARPGAPRTTSLSLPPITATTRPRRPPITPARWFPCSSRDPGCGRSGWDGVRTMADIGQTVAEFLDVAPLSTGTSFLSEVWID